MTHLSWIPSSSIHSAINLCKRAGIKEFSNYLLYNYLDHPDELYERLRINVDLCDKLGVSIYSFPMKYHPIRKVPEMVEDFSHNRDYIGIHWNRKYIRAIQAILNSTKGKIGKRAKGTTKAAQKTQLGWEQYKQVLFELKTLPTVNYQFRKDAFHVSTIEMMKNSLSANDGKRYILPDGIHTRAWGNQ